MTGLVEKNMLSISRKGRWTTYSINEDYETQPTQLDISDISTREIDLNSTDQLIYQFVCANKMITTQQVVDVIESITTLQGASVALNRLIKKELLVMRRQGRHVFYELKK